MYSEKDGVFRMFSEFVSDIFTGKEPRLSHSWQWLRTDFAEEFRRLLAAHADRDDSGNEIIWNTRHKYTLKIQTHTGRIVAFKRYRSLRLFPYLYHKTPTAREALNYQRLQLLGLPMAQLLAVGDDRHCFRPQSSFIVTEFAENCSDGRKFYPGGELERETAWRDEFCLRNFRLLAKLHDAGIYHRGFTPANELWRKRPAPDSDGNLLDIIWIDVASCRPLPSPMLRKKIPDDLTNFLHFFQFTPEEYRRFLAAYCEAARRKRWNLDDLCDEVARLLKEKQAKA